MARDTLTSARNTRRLEAAGDIFHEIAGDLHSAIEMTHEAIQCKAPGAQLTALAALLQLAGARADRAGYACGAGAGIQTQDKWLLSPAGEVSMATLSGDDALAAQLQEDREADEARALGT